MTSAPSTEVGVFEGSDAEWDEFVSAHREGRFCHRTAYLETVRAVYGFRPQRLALRRGGKLVGALAASACRSLLFGRKWVSVPFGEYGGFLVDDAAGADGTSRLVDLARRSAAAGRATALEANGVLGLPDSLAALFTRSAPYELAVLDLAPGPDHLIEKDFKYEVRKAIKKAERAGLTTREASDAETIERVFYPLWLGSMKRLGVPPHAPSYFLEMKARFGPDLTIEWTERDGRPVAALLGIRTGARVQIIATASRPEDWQDRPNDLAHWGFIRRACGIGARWFDFGSVRYEGQRHYKEKWAVTFAPAAHWILDLRAGARPKTFNSSSRTMERASQLWSKYVPDGVARWIGPTIRGALLR